MSEYTAEMVELLSAEPETEPHIIIAKDRTVIVPDELKEIAAQFDHNIETVTFDCPRYWDEHDLSTMHIYVNYRRPDKIEEPSLCTPPVVDETDDSIIHFKWTVSKNVTYVKGKLSFVVVAKRADEDGVLQNRWGSRLNQDMEILEGIECDTDEVDEQNADIIEQILYRLETAAESAEKSAATAERAEKSAIAAAERANSVAASNPNLLDNWYFADPVNQRGQTEYTAGYTIDRWWIATNGTGTVRVVPGEGVEITATSGTYFDLRQIPEPGRIDTSRNVTLSAIINGNLYTITGKQGMSLVVSDNNGAGMIYYIEESIILRPNVGNTWMVKAVKLELGSTQTLAHQDADGNWVLNDPPPDKGMELLKCQRYYYQTWIDAPNLVNGPPITGRPIAIHRLPMVQYPCEMACTPTVKIYSAVSGVEGCITDWMTDEDLPGAEAIYVTRKGFIPAGALSIDRSYNFHYTASADL